MNVSNIISIFSCIIAIIALWKIFIKMGEPGWKAIIPFYSGYILYQKIWKAVYYFIELISLTASLIALYASGALVMPNESENMVTGIGNTPLLVIGVILFIVAFVISVLSYYHLSKSFGYGVGFTVGLVFLSPIFYLILAFGSGKYQGNLVAEEENEEEE